jgi:hypothetical protein
MYDGGPNRHLKKIRIFNPEEWNNKKPIRNDVGYQLNEWLGLDWSYRCDKFTKDHAGKHVLFAGCSITAGEALDKEQTWAFKAHASMTGTSGYYNIGVPGFSITDTIDQIFKYVYNYGNPEEIYILFPNASRDLEYSGHEKRYMELLIWRSYFYLEQYCKSNNIKLYSFTWEIPLKGWPLTPKDAASLYPDPNQKKYYPGTNEEREDWSQQLGEETIEILKNFETFHYFPEEQMHESVFRYDTSKNKNKETSIIARDNVHPGESFHDFYAEFILSKAKQ